MLPFLVSGNHGWGLLYPDTPFAFDFNPGMDIDLILLFTRVEGTQKSNAYVGMFLPAYMHHSTTQLEMEYFKIATGWPHVSPAMAGKTRVHHVRSRPPDGFVYKITHKGNLFRNALNLS